MKSLICYLAMVVCMLLFLPAGVSGQSQANDSIYEATYKVACKYYRGTNGVRKNLAEAVALFKKLADVGHEKAQIMLGCCYYYGEGVNVNYDMAAYWFKKAADKGNEIARQNLATCYLHIGEQCSSNEEYFQAEMYWQRSYQLGCLEASQKLGWLYYSIDRDLTTIRANSAGSVEDREEVVDDPDSRVAFGLSDKEKRFRHRPHRYENDNAEHWFNVGISHKLRGSDFCYWYLCDIYSQKEEYGKAASSLERFIAAGYHFNSPFEDSLRLANLYLLSDYKPEHAYPVFKRYYDEMQHGELKNEFFEDWIMCGLGKCYYYGLGIQQSYLKAFELFLKAANGEDPEAMFWLSRCYRFGRGCKADIGLADEWLKKSQESNDPAALQLAEQLEKIKGMQ